MLKQCWSTVWNSYFVRSNNASRGNCKNGLTREKKHRLLHKMAINRRCIQSRWRDQEFNCDDLHINASVWMRKRLIKSISIRIGAILQWATGSKTKHRYNLCLVYEWTFICGHHAWQVWAEMSLICKPRRSFPFLPLKTRSYQTRKKNTKKAEKMVSIKGKTGCHIFTVAINIGLSTKYRWNYSNYNMLSNGWLKIDCRAHYSRRIPKKKEKLLFSLCLYPARSVIATILIDRLMVCSVHNL